MDTTEEIVCPKCHSSQLTAGQKGFNNTNAAMGMFTGGALQGLALGSIGSNKVMITCLKCGYKFQPGNGTVKTVNENGEANFEKQIFIDKDKEMGKKIALVLFIILIVLVIAAVAFYNSLTS